MAQCKKCMKKRRIRVVGDREIERETERGLVMIPVLRDLAHPLAYWLTWSTGCKVAEV